MITTRATGTQAASLGVPYVLATLPGLHTYCLMVDVSEMSTSDLLELVVEVQVVEGGGWCRSYAQLLSGGQVSAGFVSIPVPSPFGCRFTLKQTLGVGRSFPWSVIALD